MEGKGMLQGFWYMFLYYIIYMLWLVRFIWWGGCEHTKGRESRTMERRLGFSDALVDKGTPWVFCNIINRTHVWWLASFGLSLRPSHGTSPLPHLRVHFGP